MQDIRYALRQLSRTPGFALNRLVESVFFGTTSFNPLMLAAARLLPALVAVAASLIPAPGATRIAPVAALRGA